MRVRIAGCVIEVRSSPFDEVILPLFEACERPLSSGAAELVVEARSQTTPASRPPERSLFYASSWHAHTTQTGWSLFDGASRIDVQRDGRRIVIALHEDSLCDPDTVRVVGVMAAVLLALRVHGLYHLHGGCVRRADGTVVLVAGDSAHGKSTTTLALMEPGGAVLGDDTLLLKRHDDGVEIHGFPRWFHVTETTWTAFDWLADAEVSTRRTVLGKRCIDASRLPGGSGMEAALWSRQALLLLPRVAADRPTQWTPLEPTDAFGALLVASAWVVVDEIPGRTEHLELLGRLSSVGIAVDARMGADALSDPSVVARWVARTLGQ
jgi:hypothetical protein